jgi:hypothetical protein
MQEDPDGEHQENVLATGMVANSRPRDKMTKTSLRREAKAARPTLAIGEGSSGFNSGVHVHSGCRHGLCGFAIIL